MKTVQSNFPKQPAPNLAYGQYIYWLSIIASLICTIGPFIAIIFVNNNYLNPHYLFDAIWNGKTPQQIWEIGGGFPGAHFWLNNLPKGDAIIHLGVVIGCSSAALALLAAGVCYLREKVREYFWAVMCFINASLIILAVAGIIRLAE